MDSSLLLPRLALRIEKEIQAGERGNALDTCYIALDMMRESVMRGGEKSSQSTTTTLEKVETVLSHVAQRDERLTTRIIRTLGILMCSCGGSEAGEGRGVLNRLLARQESQFKEGDSAFELLHTKLACDCFTSISTVPTFSLPSPEARVLNYSSLSLEDDEEHASSLKNAIQRYQTYLFMMKTGAAETAGTRFEALGAFEAAGVCYGIAKRHLKASEMFVREMEEERGKSEEGNDAFKLERLFSNVAEAKLNAGNLDDFCFFREEAEKMRSNNDHRQSDLLRISLPM